MYQVYMHENFDAGNCAKDGKSSIVNDFGKAMQSSASGKSFVIPEEIAKLQTMVKKLTTTS